MNKLVKLSMLACCGAMFIVGCGEAQTAEEKEMEAIFSQIGVPAESIKDEMAQFRQLPVEEQQKELEKARGFLPKAK